MLQLLFISILLHKYYLQNDWMYYTLRLKMNAIISLLKIKKHNMCFVMYTMY